MKKSYHFDSYYFYANHISKESKGFPIGSRDAYHGNYDYNQSIESIESRLQRGTLSLDSLISRKPVCFSIY